MNKSIIAAALLAFVSCTKQPSADTASSPSTEPAQAKSFKGEIYRTIDDRQIVTLVSPDELELRERGTNLICKYTKQDDTLRVVANIMGTTQALYYRITPQGLQANDGTVLFSPQQYAQTMEAMQLARQRQEEERQRIALKVEQSKRVTREIATYNLIAEDDYKARSHVTITDCSLNGMDLMGRKKPDIDFAAMNYISIFYAASPLILQITYGDTSNPEIVLLTFANQADMDSAWGNLTKAVQEWSRKFPEASRVQIVPPER